MERVVLIILAGGLCGIVAERINFPGGAIVGSMLGTAVAAVAIPGHFVIPGHLSTLIQIVLGITLGLSFQRSTLGLLTQVIPLALVSTVALLLVSVLLAWLAERFGIISFATALFGLAPGGMSGMALMAKSEGYRIDIVALLHTVRIFLLFLLVPLLSRLLQFLVR